MKVIDINQLATNEKSWNIENVIKKKETIKTEGKAVFPKAITLAFATKSRFSRLKTHHALHTKKHVIYTDRILLLSCTYFAVICGVKWAAVEVSWSLCQMSVLGGRLTRWKWNSKNIKRRYCVTTWRCHIFNIDFIEQIQSKLSSFIIVLRPSKL